LKNLLEQPVLVVGVEDREIGLQANGSACRRQILAPIE